MKSSVEKLIKTPLMTAELQTYTQDNGRVQARIAWSMTVYKDGNCLSSGGTEYDLTPEALDCLAEQFHLASLQIRAVISDMDPGRRFESDQALRFGVEKLEGDFPHVEP